ncbi:hypothetical protein D3C74_300230 [compost metagenome]
MITSVTLKSLLVRNVEKDCIGRVESFNWLFSSLSNSIIAILMSLIADNFGNRIVLIMFSIFIALIFIYLIKSKYALSFWKSEG